MAWLASPIKCANGWWTPTQHPQAQVETCMMAAVWQSCLASLSSKQTISLASLTCEVYGGFQPIITRDRRLTPAVFDKMGKENRYSFRWKSVVGSPRSIVLAQKWCQKQSHSPISGGACPQIPLVYIVFFLHALQTWSLQTCHGYGHVIQVSHWQQFKPWSMWYLLHEID